VFLKKRQKIKNEYKNICIVVFQKKAKSVKKGAKKPLFIFILILLYIIIYHWNTGTPEHHFILRIRQK